MEPQASKHGGVSTTVTPKHGGVSTISVSKHHPNRQALLQILGYERIFARGERHLPLNFRDDEDAEIVFLRLMELGDDGSVVFCPTSLRFRPDREDPVEVVSSRRVPLRGWRRSELEEMLDAAGFPDREAFGSVEREPYVAEESRDLVLVAR